VTIDGRLDAKPRKATSGDLTIDLVTDGGAVRLLADASSGLTVASFTVGATYEVSGVAGQRASRKGTLDGYRIWLRDAGDLRAVDPGDEGVPGGGSAGASVVSIAAALRSGGAAVSVEGVVTVGPALLDASGRRIVVEDASAAIEVLVPSDAVVPGRATRVRIGGTVGVAYGAPRLKATSIAILGAAADPQPIPLRRAPRESEEWRLARIAGTIVDVRRLGDRWLAEIEIGGTRVPIVGLPGAAIAATSVIEGRPATVTGIVRRPYPSASDRRFAIVPRDPLDVVLGPGGASGGAAATGRSGAPGQEGAPGASAAPTDGIDRASYVDADLGMLAEHIAQTVRVGGLVVKIESDGFTLDDGTAIGRVVLLDEAAAHLPYLRSGDALNAIGAVELRDGEAIVVVRAAAGLLRIGDLGEMAPIAPPAPLPDASASTAEARLTGIDAILGGESLGATGLLSLLLASLVSAAVGVVRRERTRRRLAVLMAARLRAIGGPAEGPSGDDRAVSGP
jgi:hypothetical protein